MVLRSYQRKEKQLVIIESFYYPSLYGTTVAFGGDHFSHLANYSQVFLA